MPYSVGHLLEDQGNVTVVQKTESVSSALDLMIENDFSQLPVVDENGALLGMVTCDSILRAARSFSTKPDQLLVHDAIVNAPFHYREDDLFDLLDELKASNAVVIVDPEGYVTGIVTAYDTSGFLRNRAEDLMHIEDIEFIIKELIKKTYVYEKEALNPERLQAEMGKPPKKSKTFDDMNLGDYINLLMSRHIWKFCAPILNVEKEWLSELLVNVRQTRNDLAHFRSEISPRSREELRYCANWLRSRYQEYEKQQAGSFIDTLLERREGEDLSRIAREKPIIYDAAVDGGKTARRSRYAVLAGWLMGLEREQILLTFRQVEEIIGSPLPPSAYQLRAWWANDRAHSALWLEAGWEIAYVDLAEKLVVFVRLSPNEIHG
ncbi:MAG TPA: CBS domain-containing protein [Anaerolineales bacterium]|nr:CBS domain-containing protein [Anaerolineales bacterium]